MNQRPARAVIDTNILVPILTYRFPSDNWLVKLWQSERIKPLASEETINELKEKLLEKSPTPREYPAQKFVQRALSQYRPWCEMVLPQDSRENPQCQDTTDQKFIDLAFAGEAEALVTRDTKLLVMNEQTPFMITRDRAFRNKIEAQ